MKKKLFSLLILIIFTSNAFASNFWSNVKDGPYNVESAIKQYLSGRALDPIEGIWFDDGLGTTVIFKDQNIYKLYIIDINYEEDKIFNRTWEASFLKRGDYSYNFFTRVWYKQRDGSYLTKTQSGKTNNVYSSSNEVYMDYNNLSDQGREMDHKMTRIWPTNMVKYNFQFNEKKEPKKQVSNQEKTKKKYDPTVPRKDYKDYWWVVVILALGTFFIYTLTVKKPKLNILKKKKTKQRGSIAKYWAGEDSLAFSFWGVSTLGLTMLQIPNWIILAQGDEIFDTMSDIGALFYLVYLIVFFVAVVIAYVGCWRSAAKYITTKIKKKKSAFWGYTTYVVIVISTVRVFASIITEI